MYAQNPNIGAVSPGPGRRSGVWAIRSTCALPVRAWQSRGASCVLSYKSVDERTADPWTDTAGMEPQQLAYNGIGSESEAAYLAREHLAGRLPRRWAHVQGVAAAAAGLAERALLEPHDRALLVVSAWYHDIGYAHPDAYGWHPLDGALLLRTWELDPVANLVAWHTTAAEEAQVNGQEEHLAAWPRPNDRLADLLTYADMTTGPDGQEMTFEERRDEIRRRHGSDSSAAVAMDLAWPRLMELRNRVEGQLR